MNVDPVRLVCEARFLKHDADLHSIGCRKRKELQPIGVPRRPPLENWMIECHLLSPELVSIQIEPAGGTAG
jgi:hypothetical protein